uniref:Uncharacterized protein n=1 Tax=Oryza sativa subsp. japonica TaxID=39947 RepID=Q2QZ81_ORYSJ|nr:hypothetical protein LOC_Os11g47379 [Oryza sativa Japonica Group]
MARLPADFEEVEPRQRIICFRVLKFVLLRKRKFEIHSRYDGLRQMTS